MENTYKCNKWISNRKAKTEKAKQVHTVFF